MRDVPREGPMSYSSTKILHWLYEYQKPGIRKNSQAARMRQTRHKFGAVPCERDEKKFPSQLERAYYDQLKVRQKSGEVIFFLRQIPFELPGKVKYLCDYQVFLSDGSVEFVEIKGRDTPMGVLKIKQVEEIYPISIKVVRKV